jgi:hypothetical protein
MLIEVIDTSWFCPPGQIWVQDGNYARCCNNNLYVECGIATACLNTSLMVGQTLSRFGLGRLSIPIDISLLV